MKLLMVTFVKNESELLEILKVSTELCLCMYVTEAADFEFLSEDFEEALNS